ncbi:Formate hydrogenlyase subunit 3/Multisubunit Na+/H+ antiporter, MnhD subunit [Geoglobus ahangari]|uniref:Formate hydrogenlyase subunit 3/Multisubunit Na+/H+ antiporter, MnhD subunit n=1 Tax=Geoglobus ahangari TaxID=113653 RepID=A0A0F7IEL0_9EURY|nr:monovalent cation/H+ antiporter subunit D family protein [Geoglobus ahangari]AKG91428.1 Formate hydrogenlyase subunit 3/Multisubunit Na+/H+ antiporter, MnhD subunit [Geoglobus ahangari]
MIEHLPVVIVAISLLSSFTILISGIFSRRAGYYISLATIIVQLIFSAILLDYLLKNGLIRYWLGGWRPPWGIEYVIDELGAYMLSVVLVFSLLATIYARRVVEREVEESKWPYFYTLWQLMISGMVGVSVTGDLFNLFVFLEIASLAGYALIAMAGRKAFVASYNYLILGTVGISFYLLGTAFLYAETGTLNMLDARILLSLVYENRVVQASFVFYFIGLAIKMALFPFHTWQPDAYEHSPSAVTVLISTAMAKINAYALIRVVFSVFTVSFLEKFVQVWTLIAWIAAVAIILGSVFAIMQKSLKRMLAYSSISHVGYIVLAITFLHTKWGLSAAVVHLLNHSIMKATLFMVACGFIYKFGFREIDDLAGIGRKMPFSAAAFTIAAISMIGIPPTVGFVTKLYIILASLETGQIAYIFVMVASSLLSLVYFWRVIETMYMKGDHHHEQERDELPAEMLLPALFLAFLTIAFGLFWLSGAGMPMLDSIAKTLGVVP